MIKHILFDFDNTLSMTEYGNFLVENESARRLGYKQQSREIHKKTAGIELKDSLKIRFPGCDSEKLMDIISNDVFPEFIKKGKIDIISFATYKTLMELKNSNYQLHILTSRRKPVVAHLLNPNHKLNKYIKSMFYLEKTVFKKPDPRVFDIPLLQLSAKPNECVYVGDSPEDLCAKKAGLFLIISLESKLRKKEDFNEGQVDFFVEKFSKVPKAIKFLQENL